ncbi:MULTISPECIES: hypothetical protein [unclassified Mesorhizobium]|uniref:hypothetical protein n=1 Tax=unclassified Mesorhizobium TaxID=325217 RepID=UPI0024163CD6|nr:MULTISPECIES: hypothetical protein [unclassified Mesorhizobium]WFP65609.1 hypothetical protein QAZ47_14205 [Mesorhizobium sp. WSM4904]WFP78873.1 hypothetical protein QAZ22_14145 [Mesorhizobium sp. WSM4906]
MSIFSRISAFLGRGDEDVLRVPPMDGVYKPNNLLDTTEHLLDLPAIDNLAASPAGLYCSSGNSLFRIDLQTKSATLVRQFDGPVTMTAASPTGDVAVAVEATGLKLIRATGEQRQLDLPREYTSCVNAGLFDGEDALLLAIGSRQHPISDWKRDLMSHGTTGELIRYAISSGKTDVVQSGLAFPYGLAHTPDGAVAVAESWRHRIVAVAPGAAPRSLLGELPAYPARLAPSSDGSYWLALFAPRRQLTELVLTEADYRMEMMATIPPDAWIGPDFAESGNEEQPLQAGSVRQMGIIKPWAPSRSYGMVVRLDADLSPVASYHSRADGKMHGIASVVEMDGFLYAASRGAGTLLRLDLSRGTRS